MLELHGLLQHVTVRPTLALFLLFPLIGLAVSLGYLVAFPARRLESSALAAARVEQAVGSLSVGIMALTFFTAAYHAVLLGRAPQAERFFLDHLVRLLRIGQLDASFDLAFDPLTAVMTLVISGIGALIFAYAASYMRGDPGYPRFFAWLHLFVFSMLVLVLADNFVVLFFGWEGVGLASYGLIGFWWQDAKNASAGMKAFVVNRVGDAAFLLGVGLLFWGLGGGWSSAGYTPDLNARFSAVSLDDGPGPLRASPEKPGREAAPAAAVPNEETPESLPDSDPDSDGDDSAIPAGEGAGLLTLTSHSGALVYMDDARVPLQWGPRRPLRSPFTRFPVSSGVHSFRIHSGVGLDDALVTHVALRSGAEVALSPLGPTVAFRPLRDQLLIRDTEGRREALEDLAAKEAFPGVSVVTLTCLLLFIGACGKSAQVPLAVWLPDAMAGPTPVSALIHAATMVTAGVYLLARLGFLFLLSPVACTVVAVVGAVTALFGAASGFFQYDLKKILAYSTISQLGFMMIGAGAGAFGASVFHLITHAVFKACLFLAAGSVIHAMHAREHHPARAQDVRHMGGLRAYLPRTSRAYFLACMAISAAPLPGLAGFWSKDDLLVAVIASPVLANTAAVLTLAAGVIASGLTGFYMWRSYYLVFTGPEYRPEGPVDSDGYLLHEAPFVHESPPSITRVLSLLGFLSVGLGAVLGVSTKLVGGGGEPLIERWLAPALKALDGDLAAGVSEGHVPVGVRWGVMASAYGAGLIGWALARSRYGEARAPEWAEGEERSPLFRTLSRAFYLDALVAGGGVRLAGLFRDALYGLDVMVVDGLVNGLALLGRAVAWMVFEVDTRLVDGAVVQVARTTWALGEKARAAQTGRIQSYAFAILAGVLALVILQYGLR